MPRTDGELLTATVHILKAGDPHDARRWDQLVAQAPLTDAYYRHGYALAYEEAGHGKAVAVVMDLGEARFLVPVLVRDLDFPEAGGWCDTYSPYGYGGMIALGPVTYSRELLGRFVAALQGWALESRIVCCLLRLHPLLPQAQSWLALQPNEIANTTVVNRGPTVSLDLDAWDTTRACLTGLRQDRRYNLNVARRHLRVSWADNTHPDEDIEIFRTMYESTMQRLGADAFFSFSQQYYRVLAERLGEHFGLAIAWYQDQPAGAAIFLRDRSFGHYHLSGTNELGRRYKAATLLVNGGAAWCRAYGSRVMHLGGGMRPRDSLFDFKQSFGGAEHSYSFVTVVADPARFAALRNNPSAPWPYVERSPAVPSEAQQPTIPMGHVVAFPALRRSQERKRLRVVFMGKDKLSCSKALRHLLDSGFRVEVVVAPTAEKEPFYGPRLADTARQHGIPVATDNELYEVLTTPSREGKGYSLREIDLVISFLFWKLIRPPLIGLPKIGCINFHPAPLPELRGIGGYNVAILENMTNWGVSAHFVAEQFDVGDVICVRRMIIDPQKETAFSLERKSLVVMLSLFKEVMATVLRGEPLARVPQGEGRYISRKDFEELRQIRPEDTVEEIERKVRAFWFPPQQGAYINLHGKEFTLISEELLQSEVLQKYRMLRGKEGEPRDKATTAD